MDHYKVTLSEQERVELQDIASKGTHAATKVINALILLTCEQSEGRCERPRSLDIATMLGVSARKIDRVKKRFVQEGLEPALNRQASRREYALKVDGRLEAQLVAMSCSAPPEGHARWSLRLLADRLVELEYIDSVSHETVRRALKKRTQALEKSRLGTRAPGQRRIRGRHGKSAGHLQPTLRCHAPSGVHGRDATAVDS